MPLITDDIDFLRTLVAKRSGNVLTPGQAYLFETRLAPVAVDAGLCNVEALVAELKGKSCSPLHDRVAEAMTINETSFFRDIAPFDAVRDEVLPQLLTIRVAQRQLSFWSAAASSGQEAYSLAMLLREKLLAHAGWTPQITCTDLSDEMLARIRDGKYSQFEVNRGLPAKLLIKYFDRQGAHYFAKDELKRMIQCKKLNLAENWPLMPKFDVVFLRNVLIYFDQPMKEAILKRVHRALAPDGWLFLGGGETLINLNVPFTRVTTGKTVCFRPVA
ncbi:MAG: protein-glutamate O-methyltransferase CheR [Planctomycetaceae bacterium]